LNCSHDDCEKLLLSLVNRPSRSLFVAPSSKSRNVISGTTCLNGVPKYTVMCPMGANTTGALFICTVGVGEIGNTEELV
jgi:hypothetical protein